MTRIALGINYPWINYGWDFGNPPPGWAGGQSDTDFIAHRQEMMTVDFRRFADLGIGAVRFFLLADGLNYGIGAEAAPAGASLSEFAPLPAGHGFLHALARDFEFALKTCAELQLRLLPSLIDFHFCFPGAVADGAHHIIKCGRAAVINDSAKQNIFLDTVLEPLLDISLKYPEAIYAWEPINEPEWTTKKKPGFFSWLRKPDPSQTVPLANMRAYIAAANERIARRRLPDGRRAFDTTIGFAHWKTIKDWKADELGITVQQFHYYAQDNKSMPVWDTAMNAPCIVGEFASAVERPWPELKSLGQTQSLANRLQWIADKGYKAAFLWSARAEDQASLWTRSEEQEIASLYNRGGDRSV